MDHIVTLCVCSYVVRPLIKHLILLSLLDYVSRAHEIEICPSSIVRPSVRVAIISEAIAQISFKFWLLLPLSHMLRRFLALLDSVSRAHGMGL